jgi:N-acetylglutamate synthase-like GNAT family acetyltransferase
MRRMSPAPYRVRRAAVDDLPALRGLWESMHLRVADLERRLTEFQVVEDSTGKVVGALGFCVQLRHGLVHSEAFADFSTADEMRPLFWTRIQSLVLNHGLARLWTLENSPFWTRNGFTPADGAAEEKLPPTWADEGKKWFSLKIKDEDAVASIEKEIDAWMLTEKQRTAQRFERAKTIKKIAFAVIILVCLILFAAAAYLLFKNPRFGLGHST